MKPVEPNASDTRLRALRNRMRHPRKPEVARQLAAIETLIAAAAFDEAEAAMASLRSDYPGDDMKSRLNGLWSLNLFRSGNRGEARYIHEFALLCGTAHPEMVRIFGETIPERW